MSGEPYIHTFAGNPLDRASPMRGDASKLSQFLDHASTRFCCFWNLQPMFIDGPKPVLDWLNPDRAKMVLRQGAEWFFLGLDGTAPRYALDISYLSESDRELIFPGARFLEMLPAAGILDGPEAGILAQARTLIDWHGRHSRCAVCGSETRMRGGGSSRSCTNEACGAEHFPRTDPVVIMLPVTGDKCLLGRQSMFPPNMYSALAGFVEPGETLEEAVRREVKEEAGITVGTVHYHSSQPWPFPASLMIGFTCEATSEEISIDDEELEAANWFTRDEVVAAVRGESRDTLFLPPPFAIAHHLIKDWANRG